MKSPGRGLCTLSGFYRSRERPGMLLGRPETLLVDAAGRLRRQGFSIVEHLKPGTETIELLLADS